MIQQHHLLHTLTFSLPLTYKSDSLSKTKKSHKHSTELQLNDKSLEIMGKVFFFQTEIQYRFDYLITLNDSFCIVDPFV